MRRRPKGGSGAGRAASSGRSGRRRTRVSAAGSVAAARAASIEVAAGVVYRGGKLLIARRHPGSHLGGLWEFPGGKRQPPETFEQCLARELREELGIEVVIEEGLGGVTHAYPEKTVYIEFFRCRWKRGRAKALEGQAFKWIAAAELNRYDFPAADAELLERLRDSA